MYLNSEIRMSTRGSLRAAASSCRLNFANSKKAALSHKYCFPEFGISPDLGTRLGSDQKDDVNGDGVLNVEMRRAPAPTPQITLRFPGIPFVC